MGLGVGRRMGHGRHALVQCSAVSAQGFERAMNKAVSLIVTALTPPDLEQPDKNAENRAIPERKIAKGLLWSILH